MTGILGPLLEQVERNPERIALVDRHGRRTTFAALWEHGGRLAAAWRVTGIDPGDRVMVAVPVSPALYAVLVGLWRLGATAVFPEPALGFAGLQHAARETRPKALCSPRWLRLLAMTSGVLRGIPLRLSPAAHARGGGAFQPPPTDAPALISFSSGSTGLPKAMARSHALLLAQYEGTARLLSPGDAEAVDLVWFPVFVLANLGLGVTSVLPDARLRRPELADAEQLARQMRLTGVTRLQAPPAVCARLAASPAPPALRAIFTGGGPVFPDLIDRLVERYPDAGIHAVYGSTEAEPIAHLEASDITDADREAMLAGEGLLAGHVVAETQLKLVDDEILVAGPHVNAGYLDPARDAESKTRDPDGTVWHHTGDAGRLDEAGRLWLLGRHAARIGALYPFQAEAPARTWPGVRQAALVAHGGKAVLAIAGDRDRLAEWTAAAQALGAVEVRRVARIPLDRRHGSKIDYPRLRAMLG